MHSESSSVVATKETVEICEADVSEPCTSVKELVTGSGGVVSRSGKVNSRPAIVSEA